MLNTPFSPWPSFDQEEAEVATQVLLSNKVNYWTGGEGKAFEQEFACWSDSRHAIAVANGTVALDLAWVALGLQPGDEVVVTPRTFLASASSIINAGGRPVFADVDPDSQNITAETVARVLSSRTKAVLCVHLAGWPCEMEPILELAREHGLFVVEDCAQAHGARYQDKPVGALGDIGCWSFCQDKIMSTAGEGGMVTTNNTGYWETMWSYKDHGKSYAAVYERSHPPGFRWVHEKFGTNWRLTEIQSAIGRVQLGRMPAWREARARNANLIMDTAKTLSGLRTPVTPNHIEHAWYKAYVFVKPEALASGWNRDRIIEEITQRGAPCYSGSCSEIYLERAFDNTGLRPQERLPVARALGETSLMFLVHPTLKAEEIASTQQILSDVMVRATR